MRLTGKCQSNFIPHGILGPALILANAIAFLGCETSPKPEPTSKAVSQSGYLLKDSSTDLRTAQSLIDQGHYYQAIPHLQQAILKDPQSDSAMTGRYLLGVTYSQISDYRDAIDMLAEYLQVAPDGQFAVQARELEMRLRNQYARLFPSTDELEQQIAALQSQALDDPASMDTQMELADAYWRRGNFDAAASIYARATQQRPELVSHVAVTSRMEFLPNGEYVILTPSELQRREIERHPLVIANVNDFKSTRDTFTGVPRLYVVSGQVVNRSGTVLHGVEIVGTIYGFGNVVFDTNSAIIGRIHPGETRAFSIRFSSFDDINNIQRYECYATFQ